jgi:hypothetical protein
MLRDFQNRPGLIDGVQYDSVLIINHVKITPDDLKTQMIEYLTGTGDENDRYENHEFLKYDERLSTNQSRSSGEYDKTIIFFRSDKVSPKDLKEEINKTFDDDGVTNLYFTSLETKTLGEFFTSIRGR